MITIIRKSGILEEFPENTETDLYLFIMDHLHRLRQLYGTEHAKPDHALREFQALSRESVQKAQGKFARWWNRMKSPSCRFEFISLYDEIGSCHSPQAFLSGTTQLWRH